MFSYAPLLNILQYLWVFFLYFLLDYWTADGTVCTLCNIPYIKHKFWKLRKPGSLSLGGKKETESLPIHGYKWNSVYLLTHSTNIYHKCLLANKVKPGRTEKMNKTACRMNAANNSGMYKVLEEQTDNCLGQPGNISLMRWLTRVDTKEGQITVPEQLRTFRWHNFDGIPPL